jgi:hypothetical protein
MGAASIHISRSRRRRIVAATAFAVLAVGCGGGGGADETVSPNTRPAPTTTTVPAPTATLPAAAAVVTAACDGSLVAHDAGQITADNMVELSSLVASRSQPGILWTANDSGDSARVFAVSTTGEVLGSFVIGGVTATDWEDLAIGPGPERGTDYLYIGDIGNNVGNGTSTRTSVNIFRIAEPKIDRSRLHTNVPLTGAEKFPLVYPDRPRDAETLLVDPRTGEVLIVHKSWSGTGEAFVFRAALAHPGERVTLQEAGKLSLPPGEQVTSGDVAPAGDAVALRTYTQVLLFPRAPGTPLEAALAAPPCARPGPDEPRGESVTFAPTATSLYTVSEGAKPMLHRLDGAG